MTINNPVYAITNGIDSESDPFVPEKHRLRLALLIAALASIP